MSRIHNKRSEERRRWGQGVGLTEAKEKQTQAGPRRSRAQRKVSRKTSDGGEITASMQLLSGTVRVFVSRATNWVSIRSLFRPANVPKGK